MAVWPARLDWLSFQLSFHLALLEPTGAYWLDDLPDVSCQDGTGQHSVDGWPLSCKQWPGGDGGCHPSCREVADG